MSKKHPELMTLFCITKGGPVYIDEPSVETVLQAVSSLDGHDADTVSVKLSNGDSMDIGGGADGMYKCHARTEGGFYDLLNPVIEKDMSDTVGIQMNDEVNTFPRCTIVSLDVAMIAVESFCVKGALDLQLHWDDSLTYEPL